jgi:hypothetical protein
VSRTPTEELMKSLPVVCSVLSRKSAGGRAGDVLR